MFARKKTSNGGCGAQVRDRWAQGDRVPVGLAPTGIRMEIVLDLKDVMMVFGLGPILTWKGQKEQVDCKGAGGLDRIHPFLS